MNLSNARILLTNDDGIDAEGLKVLEESIKLVAKDVWVVAPESEQSGSGHSITLRSPLRIRKVSDKHYAINGTPTDSVLLGVSEIMKEEPPTLILSGINRGGNLGEDITYEPNDSDEVEDMVFIPDPTQSEMELAEDLLEYFVEEEEYEKCANIRDIIKLKKVINKLI